MESQIIEIASWKIIAEFMRRYSNQFKVIETHPGGGQYDCLSIFDNNGKHIIDLNRNGSLHIWSKVDDVRPSSGGPIDSYSRIWKDFIFNLNPKDVLDKICKMADLDSKVALPSSTSKILTYRFISTFMNHHIFGLDRWECRNGYLDSSGYSPGILNDFDNFIQAQERVRIKERTDILKNPAYRFWFIKKNDKPELCLETNGTVWDKNGGEHRLSELYKKNRKISEVVYKVARKLLP